MESLQVTMDESIVTFLKAQTAVTICTSSDNIPCCCICFYAYSEKLNALVFKSNKDTLHIVQALANIDVSGSILPDKLETGKIKGIQWCGEFYKPAGEALSELQKTYYKKFPLALTLKGDIWAIALTSLKFTDNTLGFGKKLFWSKY